MTATFYFIGFLISVMLIGVLFDYYKITFIRRNYNITGDVKSELVSIVDKKDRESYTLFINYGFIIMSFVSWLFIGLLSDNWLAFVVLLVLHFISNKLISNIGGKHKINIFKIFLTICLLLFMSASCLFISLNHFYFKYDLNAVIKTHINLK